MLFGHFSHAHTLAFKTHLTKALCGIDAFKIFSSLERVAASLWDWRQFSFVRKTEPKKKIHYKVQIETVHTLTHLTKTNDLVIVSSHGHG